MNMSSIGNTSSSSIPIVLSKYLDKIQKNKKILLIGFGGGLSWGVCLIKVKKEKMSSNLSALLYLITGVLFILALRGLSSPGNF